MERDLFPFNKELAVAQPMSQLREERRGGNLGRKSGDAFESSK